ncbi:MAG: hypothetical protein WC759_02350 [Candidatus Micrarchaeia archaeon]|jgi:hypothetical protein
MGSATAEWAEKLRVVVTDQNGYPVANVPVTVQYQKNRFLSTEVAKVDNPPTEYECVSTGSVTVASINVDANGQATITYNTPSTTCNYGETYFEAGNQTPTNLTGSSQLGTGSAEEGTSTDVTIEENVPVANVPVTITRFDLSNVDGKLTGSTNQYGIFDTSVIDQVPAANATNEYIVIAGSESRRVRQGDNFINGMHVENFKTTDSLSLLPVQVTDAYGKPVQGAFVEMSCSNTKNGTTDANGMIYIYTKSDCTVKASYKGFSGSIAPKLVPEVVVVLWFNRTQGVTKITVKDDRNKVLNGSVVNITLAGQALQVSANGTAGLPAGLAYGDFAAAVVKSQNYSIAKGIFLFGTARFSLPTNKVRLLAIGNYNNSLSITIVDENGAPFANALVAIPGRSAQTQPDGSARFEEIRNKTVRVQAFVMGVNKSINVTFGSSPDMSIVMEFRRNPLEANVRTINHTFDRGCKISIVAVATDPRLERQADIALTLAYGFVSDKKESRQLLVSANGTTSLVSIPCAQQLPATFRYQLTAVDKFGNYTSPALTYIVPEAPPVQSVDQAVGKAVDQLTILTGSETNALVVVTVIMVGFIIALSIAALTVLVNRKKAKEMMAGKKGDDPQMPPI